MKILKVRGYTITAWAEKLGDRWQGLASVTPRIPNSWSGGPNRDSLLCDGLHGSEHAAVNQAFEEAEAALLKYIDV